jgi:hypothetical protein
MFISKNIYWIWFFSLLVVGLLQTVCFYLLLHIYKTEYRNFWEDDISKIKENDILGFRESKRIKSYYRKWLINPPWWIKENKRARFLLFVFRLSALLFFLIYPTTLVLIALFLF